MTRLSDFSALTSICLLPVGTFYIIARNENMGETSETSETSLKTIASEDETSETSLRMIECEGGMSNSNELQNIFELNGLKQVADNVFIDTFTGNLPVIFAYNRNDIQMVIEPRDLILLNKLRHDLHEHFLSKVPALAGRTLVCRRVKSTAIHDICVIGASICGIEGSPSVPFVMTKDHDRMYQAEGSCKGSNGEDCNVRDSNSDATDEQNCTTCSSLSIDVKRILEMQSETLQVVESLSSTNRYLMFRLDEVTKQANEKTNECFKLATQVSKLHGEVTQLTKELHAKIWHSFSNKKSLVLGDNITSFIDAKKLINTDVVTMPEATVKDLLDHLSDETKFDEQYRSIFLCGGSKSCEKDFDVDETKKQYKDMVAEAVKKVHKPNHVTIASIPPRLDDPNTQNKIKSLNAALASLAADTGTKFVNNDESFVLRNGQVNDGYLQKDGVQLSRLGTQRLVKNLELRPKTDYNDVCKSFQRAANKSMEGDRKNNDTNKSATTNKISNQRHHTQAGRDNQAFVLDDDEWPVVSGPRKKPTHLKRPMSRDNRNQKETGRKSRNGCSFCGEPNHTSEVCRHGKPVQCHSCFGKGHKAKACHSDGY